MHAATLVSVALPCTETLASSQQDIEHIRGEHSTYRWLFEPLLVATGFKIVTAAYRRSVYGAYTCVKQQVPVVASSGSAGDS